MEQLLQFWLFKSPDEKQKIKINEARPLNGLRTKSTNTLTEEIEDIILIILKEVAGQRNGGLLKEGSVFA